MRYFYVILSIFIVNCGCSLLPTKKSTTEVTNNCKSLRNLIEIDKDWLIDSSAIYDNCLNKIEFPISEQRLKLENPPLKQIHDLWDKKVNSFPHSEVILISSAPDYSIDFSEIQKKFSAKIIKLSPLEKVQHQVQSLTLQSDEDLLIWALNNDSSYLYFIKNKNSTSFSMEITPVKFKNTIIEKIQKKKLKTFSPNPLNKKQIISAMKIVTDNKKKFPDPDLLKQIRSHTKLNVGFGEIFKNLSKQMEYNDNFTSYELRKTLDSKTNKTDQQLQSHEPEMQVSNMAYLLGWMEIFRLDNIKIIQPNCSLSIIHSDSNWKSP